MAACWCSVNARAAATEPLSSPVPEFEVLLARKIWPSHLSPKLAVVYRAALAAAARGEIDAVAGVTVRQPYLRTRLRFTRDVANDDVAALESRGCRVVRLPSGAPVRVGPVIDADCSWSSLPRLGELPALFRVSPTLGLSPPHPLAPPVTTTLDEVEVTAWREAQLTNEAPGQGVTVLDVDTAVDLFHPYLLRADGGRFAWLDVNGDGAFTPDIDAVDLNGNGAADMAETLRVHKATVRLTDRATSTNTYFNSDSPFEVGTHTPLKFTAANVPHEVVLWGEPQLDEKKLVSDLTRLIETEAAMFGGLPMKRYVFFIYGTDKGRICVAALNDSNIDYVCQAIADVI